MKFGKLLLFVGLVLASACRFSAAGNLKTTKLSSDYKIVYAADGGFSRDIFVVKPDGSERINLTEADGYHGFGNPVWSPDGTKIAYTGSVGFGRHLKDDIYVMDSNGSNIIQLTNHPGWDTDPIWSPDNHQIVFVSDRENETNQIFIVNVDGSNLRQLTKSENAWSFGSSSPDWSPDGKRIVFNYEYEIAVINSDGSGLHQLTNGSNLESCDHPAWSPDGTQIVFTAVVHGQNGKSGSQIFVMNADGSQLRQLTKSNNVYYGPVWSPDGSRIGFKFNTDGNAIAYLGVMNADGRNEIQLASNMSVTDSPVWSPDGRRILFYAVPGEDTNWDIYVINVDGTNQINLTRQEYFDGAPDWRP